MKLKHCLLLGSVMLCLTGCSAAENTPPENVDINSKSIENAESTLVYPITMESSLYDYATPAPNIIYSTSEEENGLAGNAYCISGTVTQVVSSENSDIGSAYFVIESENGEVYFVDPLEVMLKEASSDEVRAVIQTRFGSGYDNTFPQNNETITAYGLYMGYSNVTDAPIFYFGLNENVQQLLLPDTDAKNNSNTELEISSDEPSDDISPEKSEQPTESDTSTDITIGQMNALSKAKDYLSFMAFSHSGLIGQLEFEGFSTEEATYAADNCGADWNEQAAKKAEDYLDFMSFSRSGLIDQLVFEGFTKEQAEYGVSAVGY